MMQGLSYGRDKFITMLAQMMTEATLKAYQALISALPEAALLVDQAGIIVAANMRAEEGFSVPLQRQPVALFIRSSSMASALANVFRSDQPIEFEYEERGKVPRTVFAHVAKLESDSPVPLALILLRDRTREAQIEKMRSDFVANASHELRTPLTTLSGFIETMQGAAKQDEKARGQFLQTMKTQADRMSRLIDDLLSLSRIELDEHMEPKELVNLGSIIKQTESYVRPIAMETGCDLHLSITPDVFVRGDANQLGQVAHNLIENAVKYSGKGKRVLVELTRSDSEAILSVVDNGPGIAAHHIPRLTERFYRVNVQDSRTRGGTGLGLAICKHIINRHRGRLAVESETGAGSTFRMLLPIAR